jgi:hypothetical protein
MRASAGLPARTAVAWSAHATTAGPATYICASRQGSRRSHEGDAAVVDGAGRLRRSDFRAARPVARPRGRLDVRARREVSVVEAPSCGPARSWWGLLGKQSGDRLAAHLARSRGTVAAFSCRDRHRDSRRDVRPSDRERPQHHKRPKRNGDEYTCYVPTQQRPDRRKDNGHRSNPQDPRTFLLKKSRARIPGRTAPVACERIVHAAALVDGYHQESC